MTFSMALVLSSNFSLFNLSVSVIFALLIIKQKPHQNIYHIPDTAGKARLLSYQSENEIAIKVRVHNCGGWLAEG